MFDVAFRRAKTSASVVKHVFQTWVRRLVAVMVLEGYDITCDSRQWKVMRPASTFHSTFICSHNEQIREHRLPSLLVNPERRTGLCFSRRSFAQTPFSQNESFISSEPEPLEVEVLDSTGGASSAGPSANEANGEVTNPPLRGETEIVKALDSFSKAKVINFVKRYRGVDGVSPEKDEAPLVETREILSSDGSGAPSQFYGRVRLPVPEQYGANIYGEGFAPTEREAEVAACMHAERLIDAMGFPIFQLSSKQKRHAEAAAAAGRWAPQPGATPLDPSKVRRPLPLPIQYVCKDGATAQVEKQMRLDKLNFAAVRRGAFTPLKYTLVSAYFYDGGSVFRIKQFLQAYKMALERCCKVTALHKEAAKMSHHGGINDRNQHSIPSLFIAQLRLPIDARYGERICIGKAPTRREAIALACMHAELTIDALGLMLYPHSPEEQRTHAKECRQVNRWCVEPGEFDFRYSVPSPPPLALDQDRELSTVSGVLGGDASSPAGAALGDGVSVGGMGGTSPLHRQAATAEVVHTSSSPMASIESVLVQHSRAVNDMHGVLNVSTVEPSARKHLLQYLSQCYAIKPEDSEADVASKKKTIEEPFLVEALGQRQQETYRATVSVPLASTNGSSRESFVGIGISDNRADAEAAASMHALHTLSILNQPWWHGTGTSSANTSGFPDSLTAFAKMAGWPRYDSNRPSIFPKEISDHLLPPPVRCLGAHIGRISAPGLAADWRRRGQRLTRATGHFFTEVEDRASEIISNEENTTKEILQNRGKIPKLDWSMDADADHRIIVSPDATTTGRNYVHTLPAVRQPDLFAVNRLKDYLERHGKNFDSSLAVSQEEIEGRPGGPRLVRWVAKVQLPLPVKLQLAGMQGPLARCVAQGEAYNQNDALCMCAMHAELLLDAMGVPFYDHPLLQRKHADTARILGRWAPLRSGMRPPLVLVPMLPPPLRKEHPGSAVWAAVRQSRGKPSTGGSKRPDLDEKSNVASADHGTRPKVGDIQRSNDDQVKKHKEETLRSTAEALRRLQSAAASKTLERENDSEVAPKGTKLKMPDESCAHHQQATDTTRTSSVPPSSSSPGASGGSELPRLSAEGLTDEELCDISQLQSVHPREVFRQAFKHVQFYFNSKGTDFGRTLRQYTVRDEKHGIVHRAIVDIPLPEGFGKRVGVGCAAVKKMAPLLCACHVAWTLDALGVPIYHGRRQQLYAKLAKEAGRKAPFPGDQRQPYDTPSPKGLCCLTSASRDIPEPPTAPTTDALRKDRRLWMQYVRATKTYLEKKREYDLYEALFELKRAPRWEVTVEDDALDAVELLPLNRQVRSQLPSLCRAAGLPPPDFFRYEAFGKLPQRMFLTEVPVLGTPFTARGVALSGPDSTHRAAMHYAYIVSQVTMNNTSMVDGAAIRGVGLGFGNSPASSSPIDRQGSDSLAAARVSVATSARASQKQQYMYDVSKGDFTAKGKHILLQLFAAIRPPFHALQWTFKTKQASMGSGAEKESVVATVEWVDAAEVRHSGRGEHRSDSEEAADLAVNDLFRKLSGNASFQALVAFARRRSDIHLETIFFALEGSWQNSDSLLFRLSAPNPAWSDQWKGMKNNPSENDDFCVSKGTDVRWRKRLGHSDPSSAKGDSQVLWLQSGASRPIIESLLVACETRLSTERIGENGGNNSIPQKDLVRMGLMNKKGDVTSVGLASGFLLQCLPSVETSRGEGREIRFRHGALLPLQFSKLLLAGMLWGCLKEVLQLIAFVAAGKGGAQSIASTTEVRDTNTDAEGDDIPERDVDIVSLASEFNKLSHDNHSCSPTEVEQYEASLIENLHALHKYIVCSFSLQKNIHGSLVDLLASSLSKLVLKTENDVHQDIRMRACVAFATLPNIQAPTINKNPATLNTSFDGDLHLLSSAGLDVDKRWGLSARVPVSIYALTATTTVDPSLVVLDDVPELGVLHQALLIHTRSLNHTARKDSETEAKVMVTLDSNSEEQWLKAAQSIHSHVSTCFKGLQPLSRDVQHDLLQLCTELPFSSMMFPPTEATEAIQQAEEMLSSRKK